MDSFVNHAQMEYKMRRNGEIMAYNPDKCYFCYGINNGHYLRKVRLCDDCLKRIKKNQKYLFK